MIRHMQKKTIMFIVGSIILLAIGALIDGVFHRVPPAQADSHHIMQVAPTQSLPKNHRITTQY